MCSNASANTPDTKRISLIPLTYRFYLVRQEWRLHKFSELLAISGLKPPALLDLSLFYIEIIDSY